MNAKLLYVVNVDDFFISHRLPLAIEAKKIGYQITILSESTGLSDIFAFYGFDFIELPLKKGKVTSLWNELRYIAFLYKTYKRLKPDIIHHITIKPVIYGSLVTKFLGRNIAIVNAFSGMGYLFTESRKIISYSILIPLFRIIFNQPKLMIILQNQDDYNFFIEKKIVRHTRLELIKGSGVDLIEYKYTPIPEIKNNSLKILFHARMLRDKGIIEFYSAAKIIKSKYPNTEFILCGDIDKGNPSSLSTSQLHNWNSEGIVSWIGFKSNMAELIPNFHLIVLPSYREGLPKSLIEACAIGRPIITTDTNGCRECIIHDKSGFLVPVKDYKKLAESVEKFILDPKLLNKFGQKAREIAEKDFDVKKIVAQTMKIYRNFQLM